MQLAVTWKNDIIAVQVGAEKNQKKKKKLSNDAAKHCDLIEDGGFWHQLKTVVDNLELICLGLNMNQTDIMHLDQVLLSFAKIFLYFQKHAIKAVADGMIKRIEKHWKALDQPMFMLALILNPFEGVSCFGPKAGINIGADIQASQKDTGLVEDQAKCQNHKQEKAAELLAVPRYADLLEEGGGDENKKDSTHESRLSLVKSDQDWWKEMSKWVGKEQEQSDDESDDSLLDAVCQCSKWLLRFLDLLFGGRKETDVDEQLRQARRRQTYTEEAHLMELLANKEDDEERILDDGELEGSDNNFEQ
ncbi:hypothetical protein C0995_013187 [Termitomyces sp. Mi166|nr:hypothetical protein C0995_013187 [Termitomyces sp. Mi166\